MGSLLSWLNSSASLFLRYGVWGLFAVAFAESSFFPVPPDLILIPLSVLNPKLALWYAFVCTFASVAGGIFGHYIGWRAGRPLLNRLFSNKMIDQVDKAFQRYGGWAVGIAAFTPIPYKVFTIASGVFRMNRGQVAIASLIGRGGRFFLEAAIIMVLGQRGLEFISSNFERITVVVTSLIIVGWYLSSRTRLVKSAVEWLSGRVASLRELYQRRFRPLGAYGYYLAAGIGLAGISAGLLTRLVSEMLERELDAFDASMLNTARSLSGPALRTVMRALSFLGTDWFLLVSAAVVVAVLLFARRKAWESATVVATIAGAMALNAFLQDIFRREPPPGVIGDVAVRNFPSQHSLLAFAFYGICAYLFWRYARHSVLRVAGLSLAAMTGVLIGISRIYLALDYPSDVLAGYAVGGFWVAMCVLALETARYSQEQRL